MAAEGALPRRGKYSRQTAQEKAMDIPDIWIKCPGCGEVLYTKEFEANAKVCRKCGHHAILSARERIELLTDKDSFREFATEMVAVDPLQFPDYPHKLQVAQRKTGNHDGCIVGDATLEAMPMVLAATDFTFMAGSMGSVVGEKLTLTLERGLERRVPAVLVSGSGGGARMHEGLLSLMQMVKTCAAIGRLNRAGVPVIVILTHPSMAGVQASWASLGDVILAEPKALIGFTGQRVIEQNLRIKLPDDFQTAEFQLAHGMVDRIVPRPELRATLAQLLRFCGD